MARTKALPERPTIGTSPARRSKRVSKADELKAEVEELVKDEKEELERMGVDVKVVDAAEQGVIRAGEREGNEAVTPSKKSRGKARASNGGSAGGKAGKPAKRAKQEPQPNGENHAEPNGDGEDADPRPPAKKPRKSKVEIFPPADLDPSLHPPRKGYPVFEFPSAAPFSNGSISNPSERDLGRPMLLGAHTSMAGGPATALLKAGMLGANGLAMFVKSQRKWDSKAYEDVQIERFRGLLKSKEEGGLGYSADSVLVHGSYLINLGNPDPWAKWATSYACFKDDILRCHQLGLKLYNWHPGSTVGVCSREESFVTIAKAINRVHTEVPEVVCVIENMANANSNVIGTAFSDLAAMIALVEDKSRVRVCLDTCHLFAAGYDIRTKETYTETMRKFGEEVGWEYLAGVHLNDSKAAFGSCKDLHENIGLGQIGLAAFRFLLRDPHFAHIPIILETPQPDSSGPAAAKGISSPELVLCDKELELLYRIQAMEDVEFEAKEVEMTEEWRKLRDQLNPPKEKGPKAKAGKAGEKEKGKGGGKGKGKKGKKGKKEEEEEVCDSCGEEEE